MFKKNYKKNPKNYKRYLSDTEFVFDISGFALSSQWGVKATNSYLDRYKICDELGIKAVIMPQSIGPFE